MLRIKNSLRGNEARIEQYSFPCERMKYTKRVGELLPNILGKIFRELGFEVWVNPQQVNGVDLKLFRENTLVIVAEVLNWSIGSRLTLKRRDQIIDNLNQFECKKLLVHTIQLSGLDPLRENEIDILCVGYQVLPQDFYDFYLRREEITRRCPYSIEVKQEIESLILSYLEEARIYL